VFEKSVGKGSFGVVFRGIWKVNVFSYQVALKQVNTEHMSDKDLEDFKSEAETMGAIPRHPNVIFFIGVTLPPNPLVIITEFCETGSLHRLLKQGQSISPFILKKLILGSARGLYHLHQYGFIHRDVAARNILLMKDMEPKMSDFGMTRKLAENKSHHSTTRAVGPIKWMSPEALKLKQYSNKSDAWAFGVMIWEILERKEPYPDKSNMDAAAAVLYENYRLPIPKGTPEIVTNIMNACWKTAPEDRPTLDEVVKALESWGLP